MDTLFNALGAILAGLLLSGLGYYLGYRRGIYEACRAFNAELEAFDARRLQRDREAMQTYARDENSVCNDAFRHPMFGPPIEQRETSDGGKA